MVESQDRMRPASSRRGEEVRMWVRRRVVVVEEGVGAAFARERRAQEVET